MRTLLAMFAVMPFPKAWIPSSRAVRMKASITFEYANLCAESLAPSAHIRTSTTSAGLPMIPARPPDAPAHATLVMMDSCFSPVHARSFSDRKAWPPNLAVEYVDCRRIDADRPAHRDKIPSQTVSVMPVRKHMGPTISCRESVHDLEHGGLGFHDLHAAGECMECQRQSLSRGP